MTFFEHPRLYDLRTGALAAEWPEIPSKSPVSSIGREPTPTIATDTANARFAVALLEEIAVVTLTP